MFLFPNAVHYILNVSVEFEYKTRISILIHLPAVINYYRGSKTTPYDSRTTKI